jgi:hypothetical protein
MALLEHLPEYVEKLDKKAVSDKIFPHLVGPFVPLFVHIYSLYAANWVFGYSCNHSRGYSKVNHPLGTKG